MSERPEATPTVLIDNDRVRVTEWRFAPEAATGWHTHEYDSVIVPMSTGTLRLENPDGPVDAELEVGVPYFREAGVKHDVINASGGEFAFIETELKQ
ncbi:MAG: cupin domain-containing protein [Gaiellaceae bacterium]